MSRVAVTGQPAASGAAWRVRSRRRRPDQAGGARPRARTAAAGSRGRAGVVRRRARRPPGPARRRDRLHGVRGRGAEPAGAAPDLRGGGVRCRRAAPGLPVPRRSRTGRDLHARPGPLGHRERIREGSWKWTFLRDNLYADLPAMLGIDGALRGPAGNGRAALVAQVDVVAAAAAALRAPSTRTPPTS